MSKKTLLNEATIRRFGGLAGIRPIITSNFLTEVEVGEDELADALAAGAEAMADALEMDVSVTVDSGGGEGEEVEDEFGEFDDEEGALDDEEGALGDEIGAIDDEEGALGDEFGAIGDEEDVEDETLEELIDRILQEDDDEVIEEDDDEVIEEDEEELTEEEGSKKGEYKRRDKKRKVGERAGDIGGHYKADETNEGQRAEGHVKVVDDEYIMQEVSRRVKHRLANIVKENRRRQRRTPRRK